LARGIRRQIAEGTSSMGRLAPLLLLAGIAAGPAVAQPADVTVSVDMGRTNARVVLTHSQQVSYLIQEAEGRIEVVYTEPVLVAPSSEVFDDPILAGYEHAVRDRVTIRVGPSFRTFETFELRNPFRLVVDLQGSRTPAGPEMEITPRRREPSKTIIVIDPGHGGAETGAIGPTGLEEKTVTLDLARQVKRALQRDRSISVVLTRDDDRLISLDERTSIANHNQADLFLSIHLNGSPRASARGAETYYVSMDATDDEARTLAALENRSFGAEETEQRTVDGEARDLDLVLWDLAQNQFLAESSFLAEAMQRQFNELVGTRDRGVRQAPFRVLMGAMMPAILVEVGFISNAEEEERFRTTEYRMQVSTAIAAAVREFLTNLDRISAPGASRAPSGP
jgi:N-acetylmuramoyl-L-alanine amidase